VQPPSAVGVVVGVDIFGLALKDMQSGGAPAARRAPRAA
jgi:hypothetical protein